MLSVVQSVATLQFEKNPTYWSTDLHHVISLTKFLLFFCCLAHT